MDWLRREIGSGLQALLSLRLKDAPPAETITGTAEIWVRAFVARIGSTARGEVDAPRIRAAFCAIFPRIREWPAPIDVIELMPPRPPQPKLPEPEIPEEERQQKVQELKEIMEDLIVKLYGWDKTKPKRASNAGG